MIYHLLDILTSTTGLFADDCLLYRVIRRIKDQIAPQKDLDAVVEWEKSGEWL